MTLKSERGSVIEIVILVVLLLAITGVVVWRILDNSKAAETKNNDRTTIANDTGSKDSNNSQNPNEGYLVIKEWGIKIKLGDVAKKISVVADSQPGEHAGLFKYDGVIKPSFLPEYLIDKSCSPSLELYRAKDETSFRGYKNKKIGEYYYMVTGSPYACETEDDTMKGLFLNGFKPENIELL